MTVTEAKELLIGAMNFAAYRETDHSLWPSDKDKLFGEPHYFENRPVYEPSVWGEGEEFERNMTELLTWAMHLNRDSAEFREAIRTLTGGTHYLDRIIERAGLANV